MLKVKNLYKSYKTGNVTYDVLKNISFEVKKGEFVAVMGPSGSGKTTLLNSISCFIPFEKGEILLGGENIADLNESKLADIRNQKLGFVFQDFMLLDGLSVIENICLPQIIADKDVFKMEVLANKLCSTFGISHIKDKYPAEISGGEKQRTSVARALINKPYIILADEPTGNLDSKTTMEVMKLLQDCVREFGQTLVMITHNDEIAKMADCCIRIQDGKLNV